jgi:hypothetical protein
MRETERSPYDGRPYYCADCGLGYGEWLACDEACSIETEHDAQERKRLHDAALEAGEHHE